MDGGDGFRLLVSSRTWGWSFEVGALRMRREGMR